MFRTWWSSASAERRRRLRIFYLIAAFTVVLGVVLGQYLIVGAVAVFTIAQTVVWMRYPRLAGRRKPR
jgi:hypothetical protein